MAPLYILYKCINELITYIYFFNDVLRDLLRCRNAGGGSFYHSKAILVHRGSTG